MKLKSELANSFLEMLMTVKVYHWWTHSYAEHRATDELYGKLNKYIDKFIEVMLGKTGSRLNMKNKKIIFTNPSTKKEFIKTINEYKLLLRNKMDIYIDIVKDTDLLNIRDEILGNLNQFLYLLTFDK